WLAGAGGGHPFARVADDGEADRLHRLGEGPHVHHQVPHQGEVAQGIDLDGGPVAVVGDGGDARQLLPPVHPQATGAARGVMAGVAEGQAPVLLGPHLLDGVQDIRLLGHLHREVIVIRGPIPWLPTVNLQGQSPAHETTRSVKKRRGGKSTSVRVWQGRSKPSQRPTWSTTASAINRDVVVFPPVTEKRPAAPSAS